MHLSCFYQGSPHGHYKFILFYGNALSDSPVHAPGRLRKKTEFSLLSTVLEGFRDGVLILNQSGTCFHMNQQARNICRSLTEDATELDMVHPYLLALCESLIESRDLFPQQSLVLTQSLMGPNGLRIRAKVQWLNFPTTPEVCLLVMLEDLTKSEQTTALLESVQYNLTPREKDVWHVANRANHSYEEIAAKTVHPPSTPSKRPPSKAFMPNEKRCWNILRIRAV